MFYIKQNRRSSSYLFTVTDQNDATLSRVRQLLKGTGQRVKLAGRRPQPGKSWKFGYLPLCDAMEFDAYIYEINP